METVKEIITDSDLEIAFKNTNFGERDKRSVINEALLKAVSGYANGHTAQSIIQELGLVGKSHMKGSSLTKKGKEYFYSVFSSPSITETKAKKSARDTLYDSGVCFDPETDQIVIEMLEEYANQFRSPEPKQQEISDEEIEATARNNFPCEEPLHSILSIDQQVDIISRRNGLQIAWKRACKWYRSELAKRSTKVQETTKLVCSQSDNCEGCSGIHCSGTYDGSKKIVPIDPAIIGRFTISQLADIIKSDSVYTILRYGTKSPSKSGMDECKDDCYYELYQLSCELRNPDVKRSEGEGKK